MVTMKTIKTTALLLGAMTRFIPAVMADNPIIQTRFTADPAPIVYNNTLYLFTDHDENDAGNWYKMLDWRLYSTTDMVNYLDLGSPASLATFKWATSNAWALQVIPRNNKFYMYVPVNTNTCGMAIGVAVSDTIAGPYRDALGKPLVCNGQIDPTVFIDPNNGQAYLYWGNPDLLYVTLNQDMISYSGSINKVALSVSGFGASPSGGPGYQEGPWFYKRNNLWYMVYAGSCCSENIRYATSPNPTGPWTYGGVIMPTQGGSFTNHAGVIDYKGSSYFFYHNAALPGGSGYDRSVCVEKFTYGSDGRIPSMSMTSGPPQIAYVNPYQRVEAELIAFSRGVSTETITSGAGGQAVSFISNGSYIKVAGVDFGSSGARSFSVSVSSATNGGSIQIRTGSTSGTVAGTCSVTNTGGWQTWRTVSCNVSGLTGVKDVYFVYTGGSGYLFNIDYWQFTRQ